MVQNKTVQIASYANFKPEEDEAVRLRSELKITTLRSFETTSSSFFLHPSPTESCGSISRVARILWVSLLRVSGGNPGFEWPRSLSKKKWLPSEWMKHGVAESQNADHRLKEMRRTILKDGSICIETRSGYPRSRMITSGIRAVRQP
jgi:hypothetical protein